eukprot:scaffold114402_cov58-Attheya_sp.AAC.2
MVLAFPDQVKVELDKIANEQLNPSISDADILVPFQSQNNAVLGPLQNSNETIPSFPGLKSEPCVLLHDLQNECRMRSEVYKYIDNNKYTSVTKLYGTSGAGKTRSVLEYLSFNKGVYLVGGINVQSMDPGSMDTGISRRISRTWKGWEKRKGSPRARGTTGMC